MESVSPGARAVQWLAESLSGPKYLFDRISFTLTGFHFAWKCSRNLVAKPFANWGKPFKSAQNSPCR